MARPKAKPDIKIIEALAAEMCSVEEIAAEVGCSKRTLERRFGVLLKKGKSRGCVRLRRAQWKAAVGGNITMQIWLGKQYLNQSDKFDVGTTDANGFNFVTSSEKKDKK